MTVSKRTLILGFLAAALTVSLLGVAWACTILVGSTTGTSAARAGDPVAAEGEVYHGSTPTDDNFGEQDSPCADFGGDGDELDAECLYSLGVVNPDKVETPSSGGTSDTYYSDTCHYGTPQSPNHESQFDTIAEATHLPDPDNPGARLLEASGTLDSVDDAGDPMGTGETVMCFYSHDKVDGSGAGTHLNGREDGAAAATVPEPFLVL